MELIFGKINSGKFRSESGEIHYPEPVKPEQEQVFEIPTPV